MGPGIRGTSSQKESEQYSREKKDRNNIHQSLRSSIVAGCRRAVARNRRYPRFRGERTTETQNRRQKRLREEESEQVARRKAVQRGSQISVAAGSFGTRGKRGKGGTSGKSTLVGECATVTGKFASMGMTISWEKRKYETILGKREKSQMRHGQKANLGWHKKELGVKEFNWQVITQRRG